MTGKDSSPEKIEASKVTKPIQLLAAWLIGLITINGSFLSAAVWISKPEWAPGLLTVAAVLNVPVFLFCLFLLQTRFRPEMQEDEYYSRYLAKRWSIETNSNEIVELKVEKERHINTDVMQSFSKNKHITSKHDLIQGLIGGTPASNKNVKINDMLPSYGEILKRLKAAGIIPGSTFGSTSKDPEAPEKFIITYGKSADIEAVKLIIKATTDLNLCGIGPALMLKNDEQIYIGSYAYKNKRVYKSVDSEIISAINDPEITINEFIQLTRFKRQSAPEKNEQQLS